MEGRDSSVLPCLLNNRRIYVNLGLGALLMGALRWQIEYRCIQVTWGGGEKLMH
jgi:hypothetical protein